MDFSKYTPRQTAIINGEISIIDVTTQEINRIYEKGLFAIDKKAIQFAVEELLRRGHRLTVPKQYSERQLSIINGEKNIDEAGRHELEVISIYGRYFGDTSAVDIAETELKRRGTRVYHIRGYSAIQSSIIQNITPIERVHDRTVKTLVNRAHKISDIDVLEWSEKEFNKRGLTSIRQGDSAWSYRDLESGRLEITRLSDELLCMFMFDAQRRGDEEMYLALKTENRQRNTHQRTQHYTESEQKVIAGEYSIENVSTFFLKDLLEKIRLDDLFPDYNFYTTIQAELARREREWKEKHAYRDEYTDYQKRIILGSIPIGMTKTEDIKTIVNKAARTGNKEIESRFREELEKREEIINKDLSYTEREQLIINTAKSLKEVITKTNAERRSEKPAASPAAPRRNYQPTLNRVVASLRDDEYEQEITDYNIRKSYTKRQRDIIDGKIPLESVRNQEITKLIKKARYFKQYETADRLEEYLKGILGQDYSAGAYEREDGVVYMIDEDGVITGEIPYEKIRLSDLRKIASRAKKEGDLEVLAIVESLILEKEADIEWKKKHRYDGNPKINYKGPKKTEEWAMDILEGRADPSFCSMKDLQNIRLYAETLDDEAYVRAARFLIELKKDPTIVYVAHTKEEIFAVIQKYTCVSIRDLIGFDVQNYLETNTSNIKIDNTNTVRIASEVEQQ